MSSSAPSEQSSSLSASSSPQAQQSSAQQSTTSEQPTAPKWTLNSLVADIVREEYKKDNLEEFIDDDLKLLQKNRIKILRQWAALSDNMKDKYPDGLKMMLEKACQSEESKDNNSCKLEGISCET